MVNFQRLQSRVCLDEGFRSEPYLDTVGVATIGYGTTRINGKPVTLNDPPIEEPIARHILCGDLYQACIDAQSLFVRFDDMDDVRQEVLVNMSYNLGRAGLGRFRKMIEAAEHLNYTEMANQMRDSKWFEQVGQRALRLVYAMQKGEW